MIPESVTEQTHRFEQRKAFGLSWYCEKLRWNKAVRVPAHERALDEARAYLASWMASKAASLGKDWP